MVAAKRPRRGSASTLLLCAFRMTGGAVSHRSRVSFRDLDLLGGVSSFGVHAVQSQGTLDFDLPVAEGLVGEYLGLVRLLEG